MNAQPINKKTGERGPVCGSATEASVWIVNRADFGDWDWHPVAPQPIRKNYGTTTVDTSAFSRVEKPIVSPTLDR